MNEEHAFSSRRRSAKEIARIRGESVYLDLISNLTVWKETQKSDQLAAVKFVEHRLGKNFDLVAFEAPTLFSEPQFPIATFLDTVTGIEFNLIPGGKFQQGTIEHEGLEDLFEEWEQDYPIYQSFDEWIDDTLEKEQPKHTVSIRPFLLARIPVTQEQWDAFDLPDKRSISGPSLPIERIQRKSALQWLELRNSQYRLPSESEWEYACRAGTDTHWFHGDDIKGIETFAWHAFNSGESPTTPRLREVAQKKPNNFGLFDMHGSVREWCADYYWDNYEMALSDGSPRLEPEYQNLRWGVIRGGCYSSHPLDLRSAYRSSLDITDEEPFLEGTGFRVAMSLPEFQTDKK